MLIKLDKLQVTDAGNGNVQVTDAGNGNVQVSKGNIISDGNCFFRCVSDFLYQTQDYHTEVRREIVEEMTKDLESYGKYVDGDFGTHLNKSPKGH